MAKDLVTLALTREELHEIETLMRKLDRLGRGKAVTLSLDEKTSAIKWTKFFNVIRG